MKKYLFIFCLLLLNNCAQNSALLGPSYTLASSGSVFEAGASLSASYGFKKATDSSSSQILNSFETLADNDIRECRTEHSSELNQIFFQTLDEFDCYRDPFSILR
tara:strand:+ start:331 stop:645 length:315 start_codon:yes stop_codon:yes gene_type:complete